MYIHSYTFISVKLHTKTTCVNNLNILVYICIYIDLYLKISWYNFVTLQNQIKISANCEILC